MAISTGTQMGDIVKIIRVNLEQHEGGLICASSADLPGMVIIHHDMKAIKDDVPNIIRLMMRRILKREVEVREAGYPSEKKPRVLPDYVAIPRAELCAATG